MPIRVLLADDHRMFREGLKTQLPRDEFQVVAEAASGQDAVRLARRHQPDIAVMDVSMPELNGVDATREVLRASPRSKVIVLTMHQESPYVVEALRAGARGYIVKSQPAAELIHALREVARGEVCVPRDYWRALVESQQKGEDILLDPLSRREREVLQLIAEGKTTKQIADTLGISFKTAETHRSRIMAKLEIHETASLVRYAIRHRLIQA